MSSDRLVPDFYRALRDKSQLIIRSPNSIRPWQHVLEPLHGYLLLAQSLWQKPKKFSSAWNFGPGSNVCVTVQELLNLLCSIAVEEPIISVSESAFKEASFLTLDSQKAEKHLRWRNYLPLISVLKLVNEYEQRPTKDGSAYNTISSQIERYLRDIE